MTRHVGARWVALASVGMFVMPPRSRERAAHDSVHDSARDAAAPTAATRTRKAAASTVSGQVSLLGATGGEGGRVSDAVVYLELIAPAPTRAAAAPAPVRAPVVPRDSVHILWGAVQDLRTLLGDVRARVTSDPATTLGARAQQGRPVVSPLPDRATPALAMLDSVERGDRPPTVAVSTRPTPADEARARATLDAARAAATRAEMAMRSKSFVPHVQIVPVGGAVLWPNRDPFSHNVFSNTPGGAFDLGLYPRGEARAAGFRRPGVYEIFCNIHPRMSAFVLAVPGTQYAQPNADGRFTIADVPPGRYRLRVWHERAGAESQVVTVGNDGVDGVRVALDARGYKPAAHVNKFGQPYPTARRDEY